VLGEGEVDAVTYRCGVAALFFGVEPCEPHIKCDGCGLVCRTSKPSGLPYAWFLNNKPAPSWTMRRTEDPFERVDLCPRCKEPER
jgi:hypothetical protein